MCTAQEPKQILPISHSFYSQNLSDNVTNKGSSYFSLTCNFSTVHVTLDPPTDKSNTVISEDRRQVRHAFYLRTLYLYQKGNYEDYGVLGSSPITSGKHYREADVSDKYAWVLRVYGIKCPDSNMMDFVKQGKKHQHDPLPSKLHGTKETPGKHPPAEFRVHDG